MTPREKNLWGIVGAVASCIMVASGGFVYGATKVAEVSVLKSRVDTLEKQLDRMESKLDTLVNRGMTK